MNAEMAGNVDKISRLLGRGTDADSSAGYGGSSSSLADEDCDDDEDCGSDDEVDDEEEEDVYARYRSEQVPAPEENGLHVAQDVDGGWRWLQAGLRKKLNKYRNSCPYVVKHGSESRFSLRGII